MTFANPTAWFLLLLVIPIILFYILKIRLRQEPVSTTFFWQQVFEERRSRSFWRRLRHLISLILSLLFLSLLVGAVLNPIPGGQNKPIRSVIIVDNSAGMNTILNTGGKTRLDQVKTELGRLLTKGSLARQTAIITAGGTPQIIVGFTDHPGTLRRGIESIQPTDYATALTSAIELAEQLVIGEKEQLIAENHTTINHSNILVYTDGCVPNLTEWEKKPNVHFFPVGTPTDNIGITRFQPRRSTGDAVGYEILIEAANFGTESVEARLEVELEVESAIQSTIESTVQSVVKPEKQIIDVIPLTLESNKPQTKIVRNTTPQGGLLRATLKPTVIPEDAFPTDNTAVAFLPKRTIQHVYFYGVEDFFLVKVLQSQPNVELHILPAPPDRVPNGGVLVLHQTIPEKIPAGNVFIVDPRNNCDLFEIGEPLEEPIVAKELSDSPLMKFVHLKNLIIPGAKKIMEQKSADRSTNKAGDINPRIEILAETPEGSPIYLHLENALILTADLKRGDLALRTTFPIMVSQALNRFRDSGGELEKAFSTSEPVRLEWKTTSPQVVLKSPSGSEQTFPVKANTVSFGMLPKCGVWTMNDGETESVYIACNLSNALESNLRLAPESFYAQTPNAAALRTGTRPIYFWLALFALLFTVTEWFLYQRRWID